MFEARVIRNNARNYPGIITKVAPQFLESAGVIVQGTAKRLVRKDTHNLEGSITRRRDGMTEIVGTNVEYAEPQEYGTRFMKGGPYMRPAIDENRKRLLQLLAQLVRREITSGRD